MSVVVPLLIGLAYASAMSLIRHPDRRREVNAVVVAGAGAAYLSGGALGPWEIAFTAAVTVCAYLGLRSWTWIGVAWLLHTAWDVVHAVRGADILPFAPHSSAGCAICDPVIAVWCLAGGPDLLRPLRRRVRAA